MKPHGKPVHEVWTGDHGSIVSRARASGRQSPIARHDSTTSVVRTAPPCLHVNGAVEPHLFGACDIDATDAAICVYVIWKRRTTRARSPTSAVTTCANDVELSSDANSDNGMRGGLWFAGGSDTGEVGTLLTKLTRVGALQR
jgi:hypothetical protein